MLAVEMGEGSEAVWMIQVGEYEKLSHYEYQLD
jgi:hypothetical protein